MDNELIQALREVVKEEITSAINPIDKRLGGVEQSLTTMQSDVSGLKTDMTAVKSDVSGLKTDMATVQTRLSNVETNLTAVRVNIENKIEPNLKLLAEGHAGLVERLDRMAHMEKKQDDTYDEVKAVSTIQKVMVHQLQESGVINLADIAE